MILHERERVKPRKSRVSIRTSVLPRIRLIRLRRSMASLNSGQNWADSVLKRAWHGRGRDLSRGPASRFVRDSTAREPIKSGEERRGAPLSLSPFPPPRRFFTADKIPRRETRATRWRLILDEMLGNASGGDYTVRGSRRATQRGDDKLLGIIAVMCVGALTTQFRRCFIYRGISRCINIYPPAIYSPGR